VAAIGCAAGFLVAVSGSRRDGLAERAKQIEHAALLLSQHYACLEAFVDDPAAPEALQAMLLSFSDAAADPKVAHAVSLVLCGCSDLPDADAELTAQIRQLDRYRPDLVELFQNAVSFGIFAMFLRWDETAPLFSQLVTRLSASSKQELVLARCVADTARQFQVKLDHDREPELLRA
jgi:hypothetical protein